MSKERLKTGLRSLVIGFGSIGQRHARILESLGATTGNVAVVSRRTHQENRFYESIERALDQHKPEVVVVATETAGHLDSLRELDRCGYGGWIVVEKPLFSDATLNPQFKHLDTGKIFVGYNLRFHPVMRELRHRLAGLDIFSFSARCGQYLPTWRPGTDYRASYSATANLGGGVLRDLSHEIDYTMWLAGKLNWITANGGKTSNLEISADDCFDLLGRSSACPLINVHVDYLESKPFREIRVHTSAGTLVADLIQGTLEQGDETQQFKVGRDDTYQSMLTAVFSGDHGDIATYDDGMRVCRVMDAAFEAAQEKRWVSLR